MFQNLRKNNAWFLQCLLEYGPYKCRAPGKQECYLILESLNAKSKATSEWGPSLMFAWNQVDSSKIKDVN